ncbi:MAG: dihydrolipoyl dehydrogenase [Thaumarchaeota archaeon]|nr:dihydrolipoyl dehydrogenase [Nitrososphaerota archaeon]
MKEYDLIVVGTGSAMNLVEPLIESNPRMKIAVIDKDEPGGICLTRGCIPSKIMLYPAELVRTLERAGDLGIHVDLKEVDFPMVMERMRTLIYRDINAIREGLSNSPNIDYYNSVAEFVSPYTMSVGGETIHAKMIFLCLGSGPVIPPVAGLEEAGYLTSDSVIGMTALPRSLTVIGGGYIAAEYGHFFSAMGSKVTIVGRNPRFLPEEEPELSELVRKELASHMEIFTDFEAVRAERTQSGQKRLVARDRKTGAEQAFESDEILVAAGRGSLSHLIHPERAGIETTANGWITVNEYLETSQPNVWSFGDAIGKYLFKHAANYESGIVYQNLILKKRVKADYRVMPHAVFTYPEVASVGLGEKAAVERYGDRVLVGFYRYEDTAKGEAMNVSGYFVKAIIDAETQSILGAHIVGPEASVLIQEIINVMHASEGSARTVGEAIHIHPSLSEVVERAFQNLLPAEHYHEHVLGETL